MLLDLIRHGETDAVGRFCGSSECELSAKGLRQMWDGLADLQHCDAVVTSPLRRCFGFAQAFAEQLGSPLSLAPSFREIHFGVWEGQLIGAVAKDYGPALMQFWNDPARYPPPQGEALDDFILRVAAGLRELHAQHAAQHVLLVTHGGPIRYLLCQARGLGLSELLSLPVPYAMRTRLRVEADATGPLRLQEVAVS